MLRRSAVLALAVLAFAVTSAACGGNDLPARQLTVVGTEMSFDAPDVVATGSYTVSFRNAGAVDHELAFTSPGGKLAVRRSIPAGHTVQMEVRLTTGVWELSCHEPGHYEQGMHKTLTVDDSS